MLNSDLFASVINSYLPEPHASLLNGIIFGINLKTAKEFYNQLKTVGLLHLVVLSGTNITILAAITSSLLTFFSKRVATLISILTIILFILFVGPQAPIVRAGVMGSFTLVAIIYRRKNVTLYGLLFSILFILIFFPSWFKSISLYLSYGATLGIIFFGQTTSKNNLWRELKISLAAQVFTTPIIFLYFHQVSLISPISNILVAEIVPPLMVFGLLTAILGKINYSLGVIPAYISYGLVSYMVWIINLLSKLPFAFYQFK